MDEVRLWRKNSLGIGTWRVSSYVTSVNHGVVIIAHSSVEGGAEITHSDPVVTNNSGRSIQQQLDLEMRSRISRQKDKGYKESREEALLGSTNQLGLINPMLAQKLKDVRITQSMLADAYVQNKFDGHRCLITKQGGEMLAYSRKGKPINTIPHVLEDVERWMQDGDTLDGEIYKHGTALQDIGSLAKRQQVGSSALCYYWYDLADRTKVFGERYRLMQDLALSIQSPQVVLVPTQRITKMAEVYSHFRAARAAGYEGSMLRVSTHGYQDAKRSDQLIKVKSREDGEVLVLGARPSSQGWAILRVRFAGPKGPVEFDISAPGDVSAKTEVLKNIEKYAWKMLTIEYAMLTTDGIPFHAVATRWREDL